MNASRYIGRIGALAAALGVGAAVFTGAGVATAAPSTGSSDSSTNKPASDGTSGANAGTGSESGTTATTTKPTKTGHTGPLAGLFHHAPDTKTASSDDTSDPGGTDATTQTKKNKPFKAARAAAKAKASSSTTTGSNSTTDTPKDVASSATSGTTSGTSDTKTTTTDTDTTPKTQATVNTLSTLTTSKNSVKKLAAATTAAATTATTAAATTSAPTLSTVLTDFVTKLFSPASGTSPTAPSAETPLAWLVAAASRRELAGSSATSAAAATPAPTLVVNGLSVVATSPQNVNSLYGMFTNFPGFQGVVQGEQDFDLVNSKGDTVGSITALVSRNNSIGPGQKYTQLVVTSNDVVGAGVVGTGAGQIPPVGSVLASLGNKNFGTIYSAMPSVTGGKDVVSYKSVTPFGNFPLFTNYDAAADLTDGVSFNRPVKTADGFYLAPTTRFSATPTSVTGFPPFFSAVQGTQTYSVFDSATNKAVGSFTGLTTVTSDVLGTYTEAIYVTSTNGSTNVGTAAGQTPPVGTVYNVIYLHSDDLYAIYSAKPAPGGTQFSTKLVTPNGKVTNLPIEFDATAQPQRTLTVPGKYTLVPVGEQQIVGINGLPPREVIFQGYQKFKVVDSAGNTIGTFDADVTNQRDVSGGSSVAVLVTNVTSGTTGTGATNVPPVGSVFNFDYQKNTKFGQVYSALPSASGDVISYKYVSPFGTFPFLTSYDAAAGLSDPNQFTFVDPFNPVNMLAASAKAADCNLLAGCTAV